MPYRKGQSGNPGGRPKKDREFTQLLERRGAQTLEVDGKRVASKRVLADMVWDAVLTGIIKFPDGTELKLKPLYWVDLTKWEVNATHSGEILVRVMYDDVDIDTAAPTFSAETGD